MHKIYSTHFYNQHGASLIVALIIITILMLTGIAAFYTSETQFRLAGNLQYQNSAFNQAETAVATAESWISGGTNFQSTGFTTYDNTITPYLYPINYLTSHNIDPLTMSWNNTNSLEVNTVNNQQRYIIELLAKNKRLMGSDISIGGRTSTGCNQVNLYRITAYGTSSRGAVKIVQSDYSVRSC
jgi:Tfp pilus assembly protein PilX